MQQNDPLHLRLHTHGHHHHHHHHRPVLDRVRGGGYDGGGGGGSEGGDVGWTEYGMVVMFVVLCVEKNVS